MRRFGGNTLTKRMPRPAQRRSRVGAPVTSSGFLIGSPVTSGILVTAQTALCTAAVFSAVDVISTDIACLPLATYRREGNDARVVAPEIAANKLFSNAPNEEGNAFRLRQALMGHVLLWGNGYLEIVRNGRGQPIELHPLNPARTQPKRDDWTGKLRYHLIDNDKFLLPENVVHVAGLGFDGLCGYSVIHMCRNSIGLTIAAEEFGGSFFGNGAVPLGIIKHPRKLGATARQNLRESIYQVHQGSKNAHHTMVLEEGAEWQGRTMPLEDAQFLETRQFQVVDIARMFRVPPHKLGDYSEAHLNSTEEANSNYESTTLLGWATASEAEFDNKLLFQSERDRRIFWHHNFAHLRRANTQVRTGYYQVMRNTGAMSSDDIRVSEGLNPIGPAKGGDIYAIQGQYVPLEKIGQDPAPAPAAEPAPDKSDPSPSDNGASNGRHLTSRL